MDEYILIMRHQDGNKIASPDLIKTWMEQTAAWIGGIASQNKFVAGTGCLFEDARVVRSGNRVTSGAFGSQNETIGGYIIVRSDSVEEAVEFAKGCPVLQGAENSMEVRKIASGDGNH